MTDLSGGRGGETPDHVAVVSEDTPPQTVRDFYIWCSELGVETATVCIPSADDRSPYVEAVEGLDPGVLVVGGPGSDASDARRFLGFLGGREEITAALRSVAEGVSSGDMTPEDVDTDAVLDRLSLPGEPDLLVEVSDGRLSDALLWQTVYTELCHVDELDREALIGCVEEYRERERRYGR